MERLKIELQMDFSWRPGVPLGDPVPVGWGRLVLEACRSVSFRLVFLHRIAFRLNRLTKIGAALFRRMEGILCRLELPPTAQFGGGLRLPHPVGVVIGRTVLTGKGCLIGQNVTIGGNFGLRNGSGRLFPVLGDFCCICAGAVIAGPVHVGKYAVIGANSVVTRSVPDYAVVAGAPAKIIRMQTHTSNWTTGSFSKALTLDTPLEIPECLLQKSMQASSGDACACLRDSGESIIPQNS